MKDPEKMGLSDATSEYLSDMMTGAGGSTERLQLLLKFFEEMYEIAKPYTDFQTLRISCPNKKIPIDGLSPGLKEKLDSWDSAFVDTIRYCEWISELTEAHKRIKSKLETLNQNSEFHGKENF